jgi:hypothetical protein
MMFLLTLHQLFWVAFLNLNPALAIICFVGYVLVGLLISGTCFFVQPPHQNRLEHLNAGERAYLRHIQGKLRTTTSGFAHDWLIDAIWSIYQNSRDREKNNEPRK